MIEVVSGTDRPGSKTLQLANHVDRLYRSFGAESQILDLTQLRLGDVDGGNYFKGPQGTFKAAVERINSATGLVMIVPEYNGSYPGILKLFIDYWNYPLSFENRPIAFIGLGGRWGALRPVEHLQQVFGYRNGYLFPNRVFIANVKDAVTEQAITDPFLKSLLETQVKEFLKFLNGLKSEKLDAISRATSG
jgi:chromate reductase, NAD(P)H dehydrogenase (quinone)